MSKIVDISTRLPRHDDGAPVVCEPLGIVFPELRRAVRRRARAGGGADLRVEYLLAAPGSAHAPETRTVAALDPALDARSIAIRHHADAARAQAYLEALADMNLSTACHGPTHRGADGVFTMVFTEAPPESLAGPTLSYHADAADPDDPDAATWVRHVAPKA